MTVGFQLYNEDCFETFKRIPDKSIDMVLCDPPYGTTRCKWDSVIPLDPMWKEVWRVVKGDAVVVMTASQPFSSSLGNSCIEHLRYEWVWLKNNSTGHLNAKRMPMSNHESVLVFYKKQPTYNPQGVVVCDKQVRRGGNGKCYGDSGRTNHQTITNYPRRVLEVAYDSSRYHPTQKPVALMEYFIKTYTLEGQTILDFAMGSGTTGVACGNLGRNFIGCDNDTEHGYFDVATRRIKEAYASHEQ